MHTLLVITGGLLFLALFCAAGRAMNGQRGIVKSAFYFIPVWFVASVINLSVGVISAGYTVTQELPIFIPVFGVPAVIAFIIAKKA